MATSFLLKVGWWFVYWVQYARGQARLEENQHSLRYKMERRMMPWLCVALFLCLLAFENVFKQFAILVALSAVALRWLIISSSEFVKTLLSKLSEISDDLSNVIPVKSLPTGTRLEGPPSKANEVLNEEKKDIKVIRWKSESSEDLKEDDFVIAIFGRENMGKSCLVSAFLGCAPWKQHPQRPQILRISCEPGETKEIQLFLIENKTLSSKSRRLFVADVPGYVNAKNVNKPPNKEQIKRAIQRFTKQTVVAIYLLRGDEVTKEDQQCFLSLCNDFQEDQRDPQKIFFVNNEPKLRGENFYEKIHERRNDLWNFSPTDSSFTQGKKTVELTSQQKSHSFELNLLPFSLTVDQYNERSDKKSLQRIAEDTWNILATKFVALVEHRGDVLSADRMNRLEGQRIRRKLQWIPWISQFSVTAGTLALVMPEAGIVGLATAGVATTSAVVIAPVTIGVLTAYSLSKAMDWSVGWWCKQKARSAKQKID